MNVEYMIRLDKANTKKNKKIKKLSNGRKKGE